MTASPLLAAFDQQAAWCEAAAPATAPFTARVLRASRAWLGEDQAALAEFSAVAADPLAAAVPLRWVGGLHLLALQGQAPWSALWPPAAAAAEPDLAALGAAVRLAWQTRRPLLRDALSRPPQTNEAQRSAGLLPGLLHIAQATGLPLALLEIGASAGLNLWCERYRLAPAGAADWSWGPADAVLTLRPQWTGPPPWAALGPPPGLQLGYRAACDAHPVDLGDPGEALRLASFIWPEQGERLARLRAAQAAVAGWMAAEGVRVQAMPAADFVRRELALPRPGQTRVLMHSVVWQYLAAAEQAAIIEAMHQAAAIATTRAPLAWLRFEPDSPQGQVALRCQVWPGGSEQLLARCHPHGARIHWLHGA